MIEAHELTVRYGARRPSLDRVSFIVSPGHVYGMLGPAGAGKTTLVNVLLGTSRPSSGRLSVGDVDVSISPLGARECAAFVCHRSALHGALSARQNVRFFASVAAHRSRWDPGQIDTAMRRTGIPERVFDRPVRDLDRQTEVLLLLAIALLRDTGALVLDEPTAGIEPRSVGEIRECLREFRRQHKAILITSSDVPFISQIADRVGVLQSGRKVAERAHSEFLGRSLADLYLEYAGDMT